MILTKDCIKSGQISKEFKKMRARTGLTQLDVAIDAGIATKTIGQMERGQHSDMSLRTFVSLANAYGLEVRMVSKKGEDDEISR